MKRLLFFLLFASLPLALCAPTYARQKPPIWFTGTIGQYLHRVSDTCPTCETPHMQPCSPDLDPEDLANCENDNQEQQQRYDECMQQYNECQQEQQQEQQYCQQNPADGRCRD